MLRKDQIRSDGKKYEKHRMWTKKADIEHGTIEHGKHTFPGYTAFPYRTLRCSPEISSQALRVDGDRNVFRGPKGNEPTLPLSWKRPGIRTQTRRKPRARGFNGARGLRTTEHLSPTHFTPSDGFIPPTYTTRFLVQDTTILRRMNSFYSTGNGTSIDL